MKIVFYTHEFNINEGGPCTKRIDSLASYLSEKDYDVIILTGNHNKNNELKNINRKYKIIYCPIIALGKKKNIYRFIEHLSLAFFAFFVGLFRLSKIDYLVTTSPPPLISFTGFFLAKLKRAKLVYDVRDIWPDVAIEMNSFTKDSIYYKIFNFIAKFMYKHSDYITTVTPGKVEKIKNYVQNKDKVKYIPNGLDDNFINFKIDKKIIKKYNLDKKDTIVYIGNVGLAQNLDALVDLANKSKKMKNIQFLIFGDGAYKDALSKKIDKLNLVNIKLVGKIQYEKVYTILKYSRISFISLKNSNMTDSIPTKIFDALGSGCPILLLAKGDSCKIIEEFSFGEYADNEKDLYNKFELMLSNYNKYDKDKNKVIKKVLEKYSRKKIAQKFEREVLKNEN